MEDSFERIAAPKVATLAYDQIIKALRSGQYKIGDRFPSETEIGMRMGVSRATVREVYSGLRFLRILETRVGQGTFVVRLPAQEVDVSASQGFGLLGAPSEGATPQSVMGTLAQGGLDLHIIEARSVLERATVRLAIKRGTKKGIEAIHTALKAMEHSVRQGSAERSNDSNVAFHAAIAAAAGNPVLQQQISALINYGQHSVWLELLARDTEASELEAREEEVLTIHEKLYTMIASRDSGAAIRALNRHFELLRSALSA